MKNHIHPVTWQISIAMFFTFAGFEAAQQFLAPILHQTGRAHEAFLAILVLYAVFGISGFILPYFLKDISYKKSLVIASPVYLFFVIAAATANTHLLFVASALVGVAAAFLWGTPAAYISAITESDRRARNLGLLQAAAFGGGAMGIAIASVLIAKVTELNVFMALAVFTAIGIFVFVLLRKDSARPRKDIVNPFRALVHPLVVIAFLVSTSGFMVLGFLFTTFAVHLADAFGTNWVGPVLFGSWIALAVASYLFGWVSDVVGRMHAISIVSVLFVLGSILLFFETNYILFAMGLMLSAMFSGAMYPVWNSIFRERLPEKFYLPAVGLFVVANSVGVAIAALLSLFFSIKIIVVVVACVAIFDLFLIMLMNNKLEQLTVKAH